MHKLKLAHRDLENKNILILGNNDNIRIKIIDFELFDVIVRYTT